MQDVHDSWRSKILELLAGRPQAWLAREADVAPSTIKRVLDGTMVPSDALKWRIAGALGVRMDEIFRYPNVIPPRPLAVTA